MMIKPILMNTEMVRAILDGRKSCTRRIIKPQWEEFREQLKTTLMENLRKDFRYRLAVKYGLIEEKEHPIVFYFEEMEESYDRE